MVQHYQLYCPAAWLVSARRYRKSLWPVTNFVSSQFNLSSILNQEIELGPLDLKASDLPLPDSVTDAINTLNSAMLAIFVFYVLGIVFSGLSFLACIATLSLNSTSWVIALFNSILSGLATLTYGIGSAITTAVAKRGESQINEMGDDVGITATAGNKFLIITWVAFGATFLAFLVWNTSCCMGLWARVKNPRHTDTEKPVGRHGSDGSTKPLAGVRFSRFGRKKDGY
jgi:hypothetical protein